MQKQGPFKTAIVEHAYTYWASKLDGERLPRRQDIKPEELRSLLPYVYLVDVVQDPLSFRFRLVGTQITNWAGKEYTGAGINERDYGPQWRRIHDCYADVVHRRVPRRDEYFAPWVSREFQYYERLIAPIASDGQKIDLLFGALHLLPLPRSARPD